MLIWQLTSEIYLENRETPFVLHQPLEQSVDNTLNFNVQMDVLNMQMCKRVD